MWYIKTMDFKNAYNENVVFSNLFEKNLTLLMLLRELDEISAQIIQNNESFIFKNHNEMEVKILYKKLASLRKKKKSIVKQLLNFQEILGGR